ncbi:MAG: xylose kinase [Piptocephalis tieghemiana]|nr:MAG: xylose kinase [Piptocephalis tieghemiana]
MATLSPSSSSNPTYVLGIDLGTTSLKVILLSRELEVVGTAQEPLTSSHPRPGYSEQDPEAWWDALGKAVRILLCKTRVDPKSILSLGISGQMHGLVLVNEGKEIHLGPAILWNDTRSTEECKRLNEDEELGIVSRTGNKALEGFTLPKLLWVKEHEGDQLDTACRMLLPKDYLVYRLTGVFASEPSDASGTILLNAQTAQWDKDLCIHLDLPTSLLPPLLPSSAHTVRTSILPKVATYLGLSQETLVVAGGADNACSALAAGIVDPKDLRGLVSLGTSGVVLRPVHPCSNAVLHPTGEVHLFRHVTGDPYVMGVMLAAADALNWFRSVVAPDISFSQLCEEASSSPPGAKGILFAPWICGERSPYPDSQVRGSFLGLDIAHSRADLTRAVLEGVAFSLTTILGTLNTLDHAQDQPKKGTGGIEQLVITGGGAKSQLWLQIIASMTNTPVIPYQGEGAATGASILAGAGLGWWDVSSAAHALFPQKDPGNREVKPIDSWSKTYKVLLPIWKQVYEATKGVSRAWKQVVE